MGLKEAKPIAASLIGYAKASGVGQYLMDRPSRPFAGRLFFQQLPQQGTRPFALVKFFMYPVAYIGFFFLYDAVVFFSPCRARYSHRGAWGLRVPRPFLPG